MLAIERRKIIYEKLLEDKRVVVSDLSELFNVTQETVRRDLDHLEADGKAKKTYGGAVLNEAINTDIPYSQRRKENAPSKLKIGQILSNMIMDGDSIVLDSSTTALYVAKSIKNKRNLTIITNSIQVMTELSDRKGWKIISTGGMLKDGSLSLVGYQAAKTIELYNADLAIISVKGVDLSHGITDTNESDVVIKNAMLKSGKRRILVVDNTKLDKVSFVHVCDLSDIDVLVTDMAPSKEWEERLSNERVELIYPR